MTKCLDANNDMVWLIQKIQVICPLYATNTKCTSKAAPCVSYSKHVQYEYKKNKNTKTNKKPQKIRKYEEIKNGGRMREKERVRRGKLIRQ